MSEYEDTPTAILDPPTSDTEVMPPLPGMEDFHAAETTVMTEEPAQPSRWQRLKRGVWKHLYETPVDMSPMGPTIQPDIPFDEWYEDKQNQPPGKMAEAVDKAIDKTAETMRYATELVDYMGNIALINTADFAADAAEYARYRIEDAKEATARTAKKAAAGAGKVTRKADDFGNAGLEGAAATIGVGSSILSKGAGKLTRKTDDAGQAVLDRMARTATQGGELASRATTKTDYMGNVALNKMADYTHFLFGPEGQRQTKESIEDDEEQ